jgi:hypothetical protein
MITLDLSILNQKGTPMFNSDIFANRPNFGIAGRIFISTDTLEIYRDTGSAWDQLGGGGGGGTISGSIAAGQVAFGTAADTIGGNNNLFWDAANNRLGIGTNTPAHRLTVNGNVSIGTHMTIGETSGSVGRLEFFNSGVQISRTGSSGLQFSVQNNNIAQTIFSTGNVVIQTGGTITDTGERLKVSGNTSLNGNLNLINSGSTTFTYANAGSFVHDAVGTGGNLIYTGTGGFRLKFAGGNSGTIINATSNTQSTGSALLIAGIVSNNANIIQSNVATSITANAANVSTFDLGGTIIFDALNNISNSIHSSIKISELFNPNTTNKDMQFVGINIQPTINQVSATKITRGIYVNPTLTAAADFRAIETTRGSILFNAGTITGGINLLTISETFAPISGSDTSNLLFINPVINQTGTATGQTRGLWVNPTLTAASDWRSIQWSNNTGWGLFGNGLAPSYILGNLQLGSVTPIGSDINLQVTGKAHIYNFTSYSSGAIQPFVIDKQIAINTNISASTGICNYVSTGDNIFQSSRSVPESTTYANIYAFNKYQFGAAGVTFTATQATPGVRAISQITTQNVFKGANSGTITHMAGIQILGYYNDNTGTITPVIPNAYQLLINDTGGYGHTFTFTNRWGIYQEGINDRNYLAGNLMLNSTTDTGQILQVNGAIRVNGQASGSAGGNSGNHLIINVDGTQYKIALLNP